jgi:hypothetical protein
MSTLRQVWGVLIALSFSTRSQPAVAAVLGLVKMDCSGNPTRRDAAFQTPPPRLRIQLQADTAAKASARAAAKHLLKRGRVHTLADVYTCAYDRRLKQLPHLTVMQSGIDR